MVSLLLDYPIKNIVNADTSHIRKARKEIKSIHESYKAELRELELEFRKAEKAALETFEPGDWEKAQQIEEALNAKKISKYADMSIDEFMAEAFADAKIGTNPSEYSKKVEGVIDKYFKKKSVETSLNNDIIKPDKVVCGHDGTPKKADPGMVIDHLGKDNKTETRTFYGESGYKKKDITNHNHGFPAKHPYGKSGEHAHDYEWDAGGELKNRTTREITEDERKENSDIL